jgi:uncharacterized protein YodC (DUF2158 family)
MEETPIGKAPARAAEIAARHLRLVDPSTDPGPTVKFGDIVQLRSGGPALLVVAIDSPDGVTIAWRDGATAYEITIDRRCLRLLGAR